MMILFRFSTGWFSAFPVLFFRPVGLLLCAGLFLSVSACGGGGSSGGSSSSSGNQAPETPGLIPAGTFTMGSNDGKSDEKPVHDVTLDAFRIDIHEVTVADYKKCVDKAGSNCRTPSTGTGYNWEKKGREKHPVNGVDWNDATAYCKFAGKRLPTEAEWERAASWKIDSSGDGKKYKYPSGKDTVSCMDVVMKDNSGKGCGQKSTWEVGSKPKEINGTYDMAGNVWEWVSDRYGVYQEGKQTNPKGQDFGNYRVFRGGGWGSDNSPFLRGANRGFFTPARRSDGLGFRCVGFGP